MLFVFMDQRRQKKLAVRFMLRGACSPMVEHVVCNDEIWVRFPAGPFFQKKNGAEGFCKKSA